ncbi:MAG: hypothetical protein LH465_10025, partial [Sphingomonas bacterium]|nr:hypothetical protein [Sphingomonas bacterium]
MRKIILTALLASAVAMPAMAQDQAKGRWQRSQDSQSASSDDDGGRPARAERAERVERPERAARIEQVERVRAERPERAMSAPTDAAREQGGWSQRVHAQRNDQDAASPVEARRAGIGQRDQARQNQVRRDPRSGQSFAERLAEHRRPRGATVTEGHGDRPAPAPQKPPRGP